MSDAARRRALASCDPAMLAEALGPERLLEALDACEIAPELLAERLARVGLVRACELVGAACAAGAARGGSVGQPGDAVIPCYGPGPELLAQIRVTVMERGTARWLDPARSAGSICLRVGPDGLRYADGGALVVDASGRCLGVDLGVDLGADGTEP